MMPTIVEQFRQQNSHWNLPTTRRPNNISSAAHPDYSNTFNLFHALFLVICSVVIMLASPTVHAIDESGIVTVPCGTETTYGPVVALNTTFLLRDCYNSPNNTGLIVYLNSASEALAGLSIVVENSNRVYVIVAGVARFPPGNMLSLNISKVNIVCRNVTNDIAANFSMFRISSFSAVRNAYLYVSDVRHFRSTTILNLNYVDSFSGLTVTIANTSSFATNALVSFALIADAVRDSSVTMTNVTSISSFVSLQAGVFDPLLPVYEVFAERTNISLISCAMVGSSNTSPFAVYISDTHMDQQSHIAIVGLQVQMATAQSLGALLAKNSNIGDVYVSIFNFSSISPNIVVQVVVTQNTTLDGAVIAVNSALISGVTASSALCFSILSSVIANAHLSATNVSLGTFQSTTTLYLLSVQYFTTVPAPSRLSNTIITLDNCKSTAQVIAIQNTTLNGVVIAVNSVLISGVTAPQAFCFNILSSTVANSYLSANNVSLSASQSTTVLYLLVVQYSATVPAPSSLSNTSITLSNCSTAALSAIAHVLNVAVTTTQLSVINVVMSATSPYLPILLSSLPGTTNQLNLTVLDSYLIGAYLIRLDMLTAVNSNVALSASTLVVTQSAYFPSNALFALTIVSAVLTNSTSTVSTTDVVGVPSGLNAGWIVGIASCTFSGVSVSLSFASLTKSGGILYVGDSVLDSTTTVTAAVASSITIPSGFPNQVFYVLSTTFRKNSTLKLLLPPLVRMDAASSTTAGISALYIAGSTLSELSSIQVSGVGPGTHLHWPNGTLWLDSCNVHKDSSIHLSNLVVNGTDANIVVLGSTPSAVLMVENCSFAQLRAAMQSRQFIAIVAPTVSASLNAAVFLMRCTFTTAAWDPQIRNALVALSGVTSKGNASCTLMFESDQLTLFGVNLLIGVTTPNNSQTTVLVTSVVLRCGWWGRYSFTSSLSPIHLAMKGKLLRGENTAITPATTVAAVSGTLLAPAPSATQCALPWNNDGGSWTPTETRGLSSITFANTVSTYHPTHTITHDPSNSREKTSLTSHLSSSRTVSNAKSVTLALFRTLSFSLSKSGLSNSVVHTVSYVQSYSEETTSHTYSRPLLTESSPALRESTTPSRFHHSLTPTSPYSTAFSGTNTSTSITPTYLKKPRRSFSFTTSQSESLQSSTATLASPSRSPSTFSKSLTIQPFLSTTMTGASPLTSTSTHNTSTTPTTLTSVTQCNIVSPSHSVNSTHSVSIIVPAVELVLGAPAAIQAAAFISFFFFTSSLSPIHLAMKGKLL
ncbi:membrane-associated protein, putative, partial [Bodo saltans]